MRPLVVTWNPPTEFRWRGTFVAGFLFSGEHGFKLEKLADSSVRFHQDETFTGLLVPLYARLRMSRTRAGFALVNEALRARAEGTDTQAVAK